MGRRGGFGVRWFEGGFQLVIPPVDGERVAARYWDVLGRPGRARAALPCGIIHGCPGEMGLVVPCRAAVPCPAPPGMLRLCFGPRFALPRGSPASLLPAPWINTSPRAKALGCKSKAG